LFKRFVYVFVVVFCIFIIVGVDDIFAHQPAIGEPIGVVLHTDIRVFIDAIEIEGFNINDYTYVVAEDLVAFGMDVAWDGDTSSLYIVRGSFNTEPPKVDANQNHPGSFAFFFVHTEIVTYIDGNLVQSFNVDGRTVVRVDDLAAAFGNVFWDERNRLVLLHLEPLPQSEETVQFVTSQFMVFNEGNRHGIVNLVGDVIVPAVYSQNEIRMLYNLTKLDMPMQIALGDWFGDLRESLPRHIPLRIIDILTGIEYNVASFSNGNHADVEPVTANDTELMFATQPASWTGRPVIVVFDDRAYVAAIHTMPHDVVHIRDNNLDGHICLHFNGSTQHISPNAVYAREINQAYEVAQKFLRYFGK